jgi:ABC-type transporter MlaC component
MKIILTLAILLAFTASLSPADSAAADNAKAVLNTSPVAALKDLYDNDEQFHATMDEAFANMKDPDPKTADL